jgi:uncharacterized protein (TIGR00730 family)
MEYFSLAMKSKEVSIMEKSDLLANTANHVTLSDEDASREVIKNVIGGLWEAVNELTRLRPTRRDRYNVSIFGSARVESGDPNYKAVKDLAKALAEMDCNIITGGGPGMMQAANEGATGVDSGNLDRSVGIRIELPFEQDANPFVKSAFEHKTFFTRLHHFVLASDAFIVVPGGIGTVLEAMMVWQLLQVRHVTDVPLVFVGEMWEELVDWARKFMLNEPGNLANPEDLNIPVCANSAEMVIGIIQASHARWSAVGQ